MTAREPAGILIGIAGGSGSGKTSVARSIYDDLGPDKVIILRQDNYYHDLSDLPDNPRRIDNWHPLPYAILLPLINNHCRVPIRRASANDIRDNRGIDKFSFKF